VLQAAGRVIRTPTDKGVVLLLDARFIQARYRKLLPGQWNVAEVRSASELREGLQEFWARSNLLGK
jgi:Rad3-related DNA helicase